MNEDTCRAEARIIAKNQDIGYQKGLDQVARANGHANWGSLLRSIHDPELSKRAGDPAQRVIAGMIASILEIGEDYLRRVERIDQALANRNVGIDDVAPDDEPEILLLRDAMRRLMETVPFEISHIGLNLFAPGHPWRVRIMIRTSSGPVWCSYQSQGVTEHAYVAMRPITPEQGTATAEVLEAVRADGTPQDAIDPTLWGFDVIGTVLSDQWGRNDLYVSSNRKVPYMAGVICVPTPAHIAQGRIRQPEPNTDKQDRKGLIDPVITRAVCLNHPATRAYADEIASIIGICPWGYSLSSGYETDHAILVPRSIDSTNAFTEIIRTDMGAKYAPLLAKMTRDIFPGGKRRRRLSVSTDGITLESDDEVLDVHGYLERIS